MVVVQQDQSGSDLIVLKIPPGVTLALVTTVRAGRSVSTSTENKNKVQALFEKMEEPSSALQALAAASPRSTSDSSTTKQIIS
jgi:hypothetical protein